MTLLIIFFLLSITTSFFCSIWEAVLLSITPSFVKRKVQEGSITGTILEQFKKDIDKPLSAILTLNTIAHTVGAIGVGAQAGKVFGANYFTVFGFHLSYESIIAAAMTLAILILSEIIPKTIGANNWQSLASFSARSIQVIVYILFPFVWVSQLITKTLKKNKEQSVLSRSDFAVMAQVVEESGELQKDEYRIIKNLLSFEELKAKDVMTPRTVIRMAEEDQTLINYYEKIEKQIPFSRIPLYHQNKDFVTGLLLKDDLLKALVEEEDNKKLSEIKRSVLIVSYTLSLPKLFDKLLDKKEHLAIVVDEYGGVMGLVTLEDIVETLFGKEIMDEKDTVSDLQSYARNRWQERAKKMGLLDEEE
ncbi:MAG: HlyC/CorC family transporter [Chitinophagales bacterium]|nr:HlyC/CorC family transporter [Chitinophagales bacterium]